MAVEKGWNGCSYALANLRGKQKMPPFAKFRCGYYWFLMKEREPNSEESTSSMASRAQGDEKREEPHAELVALFRLLMREPPTGHDFRTCPSCKQCAITTI